MEEVAGPFPWPARRRLMRVLVVGRAVLAATLRDGYIHAGNIAYLSLVTMLPLIILITSVTAAFGQTDAGYAAINGLLKALPDNVADLFEPVIDDVIAAHSGYLLWAGGLVALWTVTTFIETLRDIIHRAFRIPLARSFLAYRLRSMGATLAAMLLVVVMFVSQVVLVVALKAVQRLIPPEMQLSRWFDLSQFLPPVFIFLSLWALFKLLAPTGFRKSPGWPGALVTTLAWIGGSLLLGPFLARFGDMSLTYGALSGVMVALLFFYAVGLALVLGAELNAALAKPTSETALVKPAAAG